MKLIKIIILIIGLLIFTNCIKKSGTSSSTNSTIITNELGENVSDYLSVVKIKKGEKVELDSPEKFVQLWILLNHEQKQWLKMINENSNLIEDIENYLDNKRKEFYKSFGLTEDDFTQYSITHFKEIELFLEKNIEYKKAYYDSIKNQ